MKKIVILGLFFNFILVHAQDKVVTKNGKEIEVNKDASTTSKGIIQLAGDLGGTADLPTVPGLATKQNLLINPVTGTGTINYLSKFSGTSTLSNSLLFDNGTNIGIGTTAPVSRFHIEGATAGSSGASGSGSLMWLKQTTAWGLTAPYALWVDGYSYLNGFRISGTDGQRAIYNQMANIELGFGTNGGDITFSSNNGLTRRVYILNSNGNMGIGTSIPSSKLEISTGSAGSSGLRFTNLTNTTAGAASFSGILGVNSFGDVGIGTIPGSILSGLTSGQVTFGGTMGNLAQSASLFWDQTNNRLGIGTSSPSTNLHVSSLTATNTINADAQVLRLSRPTNNGVKWDNIAQFNLGSYSLGGSAFSRMDLAMNDGGSTSTSNVMTWQANGNIGIGSTAPGSKLEILHNSLYTGTESSTHGLQIASGKTNSDYTMYMGSDKTNGNSYLQSVKWSVGTAPLVLNARGGNVGIGTPTPTTNLDVVGGMSLRNVVGASGSNYGIEFNTNSNSPRIDWIYNGSYTGSFAGDSDFFFRLQNSRQGSGGFRFMTNPSGTALERMTILNNGNIGIANTNPAQRLTITGTNNQPAVTGTVSNATVRIDGSSNHALDIGTYSSSPFGSYIQSVEKSNFATSLPLNLNPVAGNVGIGISNPSSKLEVNGAATNTTAFNAAAGTSIDFSKSNLAYTTASAGAFTLTNIKDGGTYTLAVQGATSGTSSFTASGFTFKSPNNGTTTASKHTLYTFIVMGTTVYYYMTTGL